jgi:hypothetical protein
MCGPTPRLRPRSTGRRSDRTLARPGRTGPPRRDGRTTPAGSLDRNTPARPAWPWRRRTRSACRDYRQGSASPRRSARPHRAADHARRPRVRCAWPASAALAAELAPLCGRDRNAIRRWSSRAEGAPAGCRVRRADTRRPGVLPRAAGPPLPWCRGERRASSHGNVEETKGPRCFSHSGVGQSQAGIAGTNGSIAGLAENRSQAEVLIRPGARSTETSPAGRN